MENPKKIWNRKFVLLFITNLLVLAAINEDLVLMFDKTVY